MTSAAITERGSIMNLAVQNTPVRTETSDAGFTQVMDKAVSAKKAGNVPDDANLRDAGKKNAGNVRDERGTEETAPVTEEARQTESAAQERADAAGNSQQTAEKDAAAAENEIDEAGEEAAASQMGLAFVKQAEALVEQVAESLSVSTGEVMQAMQELGMELTDILDPGNMAELVMQVTGEDAMTLVTDEALYAVLKELTGAVQESGKELMNEYSVTPEEFRAMLDKLGEAQAESGDAAEAAGRTMQDAALAQTADEEPSAAQAGRNALIQQDAEPKQQEQSRMNQGRMQGQTAQAEPKLTVDPQTADQAQADTRDGQELMNGGEHSFAQQLMNRTNEFVEALTQEADTPYTHADAEQIMKQVTDFIRLQVGSQLSEVELQLHPASLGTLNISVAAKNGIVTAQFTAQDEAVRAILEGQIVELRNRLEEQGVKVEAVEVTVASHEFERNLEQNADQDANERGEAETKRRTTRRLNLDELGEGDAQELDEGEQIARDMMRIHGNRLDYLA